MSKVIDCFYCANNALVTRLPCLTGVLSLALRLYLAPVLLIAGWTKFEDFSTTVQWFDSLGIPLPTVMAVLAASTELLGGLLLVIGLAVRWISIPLAFTMIVAITSVHWQHGWFAIAPSDRAHSPARVLATVGLEGGWDSLSNSDEVGQRLRSARQVLREHGNYPWLTERGGFVVLNNGIELAVTYLLMLLTLLFIGGGPWLSADYWLHRKLRPERRS